MTGCNQSKEAAHLFCSERKRRWIQGVAEQGCASFVAHVRLRESDPVSWDMQDASSAVSGPHRQPARVLVPFRELLVHFSNYGSHTETYGLHVALQSAILPGSIRLPFVFLVSMPK